MAKAVRKLNMQLFFDVWDNPNNTTIETICGKLTEVEDLSIVRFMWHHDTKAGKAFVEGFRGVKRFHLQDSFFWNADHFAYVLSSFPLIESFHSRTNKPMKAWEGHRTRPEIKDPGPAIQKSFTLPSTINDLEIVNSGQMFWNVLALDATFSHLRRLDLACHQKYEDFDKAKILIKKAGGMLEDLRIYIVFNHIKGTNHDRSVITTFR